MMKPTRDELNELARKWLSGTITPDEKAVLDQWYDYDADTAIQRTKNEAEEDQQAERMLANIHERKAKVIPMRRKWQMPAAAAAILIVIGAAGYFYTRQVKPAVETASVLPEDFAPGSNKAILTLSGGKKIVLNDAKNGELANEGNTLISKTADGDVVYRAAPLSAQGRDAAGREVNEYNTMTTPRGGQYHLTLADGTGVWLNAASSITYPSAFKGKDRQVEISGEVYFEVAHDASKPFRVKNGAEVVEVLGTHFNINAYQNEGSSRTTLLEGSVRIAYLSPSGRDAEGREGIILKPGQQAIRSNNTFKINAVETGEVVAWKNGYFQFVDADIETMMRQIARWYDVDIEFEGPVTKETFTGRISRFRNISQVLKIVQSSRSVQLTYQGRRIIVR
ncbi:MAG: FecR domain-containing protein [Bacteroidota bacterium]